MTKQWASLTTSTFGLSERPWGVELRIERDKIKRRWNKKKEGKYQDSREQSRYGLYKGGSLLPCYCIETLIVIFLDSFSPQRDPVCVQMATVLLSNGQSHFKALDHFTGDADQKKIGWVPASITNPFGQFPFKAFIHMLLPGACQHLNDSFALWIKARESFLIATCWKTFQLFLHVYQQVFDVPQLS